MAKIALILSLLLREPEPVVLTHYGIGDGLLGQHHGAYWHGDACGLPPVVDLVSYGTAAPRWIPYCTKVLICYGQTCVIATVVDRQANDVIDGKPHFDLWPAAAEALGMVEAGLVKAQVWIP
jgi:hypothetical protein